MKPNQRIELNTALCPVCVPDTYQWFSFEAFYNESDDDIFCDVDINHDDLVTALTEQMTDIWQLYGVTEALSLLGLKFVECGDFHSPREYNFRTDDIDLYFETTDDFSEEKLFEQLKKFEQDKEVVDYLKRHYTSCSGFWSFTPDTIDGIIEKIRESDDDCAIAAAIMAAMVYFIGIEEVNNGLQKEYYENVCGNCDPIKRTRYINQDLIDLYNDDSLCDEVWNALTFRVLGKHERWTPNERHGHDNFPNNDAANMIMWAQSNGYSAADLVRMAKEAA